VDLFVSAANRQMDALQRDGLVDAASRRVLAGNELVLVAPASRGDAAPTGFASLADPAVERVALGEPGSVPAGEYARAALERLGIWDRVRPKVVFTANVRQALTYAERGEVDAALVYRTDARGSRAVRVVASAPPGSHPPIVYPAALVVGARPAARDYLDFLSGSVAAEVLRRHGFTAPAAYPG
jgi:molybdate transport system substrate-binding protein